MSIENDNLTEDAILNKHLDMAIEAQDGKVETSDEADTANTEEASEQDSDKQTVDTKDSDSSDKDKDAQQLVDKKGTKDKSDSRGPKDLTLADGTVIKGGPERRFYDQLQTAKQQVQFNTERATKAEQELENVTRNYKALHDAVQSAQGMPAADLSTATRMYTDMKQDPIGTLQKLLAEAIAAGYKIEGIASGVDAKAIERIIEQKQSQMQTPADNEAQIVQEAEAEWTQFIGRFPDALPHDALLASMLRDNPSANITDAYFNLKSAFAERGLDWNRPLAKQQLDASQQQQQSDPKKPLPNGRPQQNDTDMGSSDKVSVASENADLGDIIKESMREAGMNIN